MAKFDGDFNVAAIYHLSTNHRGGYDCECPAGGRPSCKHRKMVPIFLAAKAVDTLQFYEYETQMWHQPIPTFAPGDPTADKAVASAASGWTGEPCPVCNGSGVDRKDDSNRRPCNACGGTGEQYIPNPPPSVVAAGTTYPYQTAEPTDDDRTPQDIMEQASRMLATPPSDLATQFYANDPAYAGEGPGPSTLAATLRPSPSQDTAVSRSPDLRGEPAPTTPLVHKSEWDRFKATGYDMSQFKLIEPIPTPKSEFRRLK